MHLLVYATYGKTEMFVQPKVNFEKVGTTSNPEPVHSIAPSKMAAPGAGRRGYLHWTWSFADQQYVFTDYTDTTRLVAVVMQTLSSLSSSKHVYEFPCVPI